MLPCSLGRRRWSVPVAYGQSQYDSRGQQRAAELHHSRLKSNIHTVHTIHYRGMYLIRCFHVGMIIDQHTSNVREPLGGGRQQSSGSIILYMPCHTIPYAVTMPPGCDLPHFSPPCRHSGSTEFARSPHDPCQPQQKARYILTSNKQIYRLFTWKK